MTRSFGFTPVCSVIVYVIDTVLFGEQIFRLVHVHNYLLVAQIPVEFHTNCMERSNRLVGSKGYQNFNHVHLYTIMFMGQKQINEVYIFSKKTEASSFVIIKMTRTMKH